MLYSLGLLAFVAAWLLPGHYFPWTGFQQEVTAAGGAVILAIACLVSQERGPLRVPASAIGAGLLAVIPMLQWLMGQMPYLADALLPSLYLLAVALTVVSSRALATKGAERFTQALMIVLLLGAALSTVIGLGQGLRLGWEAFVEQLQPDGRVFANFTQPNHLATLLGMGLVAAWWLFEKRHVGAIGASALGAFVGLGLVMTQSRAAWAFVALYVLWWIMKRRALALRTSPLGVAAAVGCFVAATIVWPMLSNAIDGSAMNSAADRVQSIGGRRLHWPAMWDAAWRQPWTGWGWLQGTAAQLAVALDHPPSHEWISYSHNVILDLLVWNGVVIGTLIIAAGVWWIATRVRGCADIDSWALLAAGGVILTHSLLEFPYAYAYFLLPLAVFVGVVESRTPAPLNSVSIMPRPVFAILVAAMVGFLCWIAVEYEQVEEMSRRARFSEAGFVVPDSEKPAVPALLLLDSQRDFIRFRITEAKPSMPPDALEVIRHINGRFAPPAVMLRYALAMGLNGHPDDAQRNLRLICQIWPEKQCEEGRKSWASAQARYPQLGTIAFPAPQPQR